MERHLVNIFDSRSECAPRDSRHRETHRLQLPGINEISSSFLAWHGNFFRLSCDPAPEQSVWLVAFLFQIWAKLCALLLEWVESSETRRKLFLKRCWKLENMGFRKKNSENCGIGGRTKRKNRQNNVFVGSNAFSSNAPTVQLDSEYLNLIRAQEKYLLRRLMPHKRAKKHFIWRCVISGNSNILTERSQWIGHRNEFLFSWVPIDLLVPQFIFKD